MLQKHNPFAVCTFSTAYLLAFANVSVKFQSANVDKSLYREPQKQSTLPHAMKPQTHIVPRCKNAHGISQQLPAVVLTLATLEEHFSLPLNEAAKQLGVCETSLKRCVGLLATRQNQIVSSGSLMASVLTSSMRFCSACRKIGITKWPYRKVTQCLALL